MDWIYLGLMGTALVVGVLVRRALPRGPHETRLQRLALFLGAIIGSTFFAKLPYALSDWQSLVDGSAWLKDGRTITWGLAGGYLGVEVAKLVAGVRHKTGDAFAAPVAASIAIGRLGCFHAGCCFGGPTDLPWAVRFQDGLPRHPTQLYEFAFHATAAVLLLLAARRGLFRMQLIKLYLMAYMLWRIATELLRPEPRVLWGLTFYQLSSMAFFLVFALLFLIDARKPRAVAAA
ncbi:MAG: prolipoprotein diacylglyceryl transferase [Polyangiaceae bacterium]|nr:prolipoprotein diacylglyceryl transferase [Polyangiaceae bacterium]